MSIWHWNCDWEGYNMKIYIAGKITGNENYKDHFKQAELKLKSEGHQVINPTWKPLGLTYKQYIDMGLMELSQCDGIYLLDGWKESKGARLEKQYSETIGLEIIEYGCRTNAI